MADNAQPAGVEAGAPRPVFGYFRSPEATFVDDGVWYTSDALLVEAAQANRVLALTRVREARWPGLTPFEDVAEVGGFHDGEVVGEVHGDANFGRQGAERQTYEVLSFCNEVLRYGPDLHRYHRRLYAWALCFSVGRTETFVVAANNFGRLRRLWPSAVFLER